MCFFFLFLGRGGDFSGVYNTVMWMCTVPVCCCDVGRQRLLCLLALRVQVLEYFLCLLYQIGLSMRRGRNATQRTDQQLVPASFFTCASIILDGLTLV